MNNELWRVVVATQLLCLVIFTHGVSQALGLSYEETMEEMLIQCSSSQQQQQQQKLSSSPLAASKARSAAHECEKSDPYGEYKNSIATLKTRYSKREFLCAFFSKAVDVDVELTAVFSHANFTIHSVSLFLFFFKFCVPAAALCDAIMTLLSALMRIFIANFFTQSTFVSISSMDLVL